MPAPRLGEQLLRGLVGIEPFDLPADILETAKQCVLDWFGVTLAGVREELAEITRAEIAAMGGSAEAGVVGTALRAPAALAALANGCASHALDYDDTNLVMMGHATAPVLPAVLAEAEAGGRSGAALLAAFVAGVETECRLGLVVSPGHYDAGWHPTGTLGTFGSAAAACHLAGLPESGWQSALAIAATQAAGLKAAFGTMGKPLHAGKAAFNGLLAARLAGRGFTGGPDLLDGPQGFIATHAPDADASRLDRLQGAFLISETLFKYHAACYLTHSTIENLRVLRADGVSADSVRRIDVAVHPAALKVCAIAEPRTGLEGKFSLRVTAAMALLGNATGDPATFTDARVAEAELVELRDRVTVRGDAALAEAEAEAEVSLRDGSTRTLRHDAGRPLRDADEQWRRLEEKFRSLAAPVLGRPGAEHLREAVRALESLPDAGELVRVATPD